MDYPWVLSAWQVLATHVHSPLVSDYSRVLHAQQDSLASIRPLLASTKLHNRNYSRVFSTRQQSLASSVLLVSHEPNTRVVFKISRGTTRYSRLFVNLDVSCTVCIYQMHVIHTCFFYCFTFEVNDQALRIAKINYATTNVAMYILK